MTDKKHLRQTVLFYRRLLSDDEYIKRNLSIQSQILNLIRENDFSVVHVFLPIEKNREPDLTGLFTTLWSEDRKVMVSRSDFDLKTLDHFWLEPQTRLELNRLGIPEPVSGSPASIQDSDVVFVPLVAADKKRNRIGYGGGFYDRLLAEYKGETVGVSLAPLFDNLGTDEWDIPVKQMIYFQRNTN